MLVPIMFYIFAGFTLLSAVGVISVRNPVHSVLLLIFAFFNAAGLMVLLGAEFLAMLLVIVYVGAVAILFLFVVMMMDIDYVKMRQGFLHYLPIGALIALILFVEFYIILQASVQLPLQLSDQLTVIKNDVNNVTALGRLLYTDYVLIFQLSGLVLLIAMVGAIVLSHRTRQGVRKQVIGKQVSRKRSDSVRLKNVESGKGV